MIRFPQSALIPPSPWETPPKGRILAVRVAVFNYRSLPTRCNLRALQFEHNYRQGLNYYYNRIQLDRSQTCVCSKHHLIPRLHAFATPQYVLTELPEHPLHPYVSSTALPSS